MGVIPILEEKFKIDGTKWEIAASTTTSDMACPEDGTVQILARKAGEEEWTHCCHAPVKCIGSSFLDRFLAAFRTSSEFRNRCERVGPDDASAIDQQSEYGTRTPKLPAAPPPHRAQGIARLLKLGGQAKFRDYASLKSGRDEFSARKEPELSEMLGDAVAVLDTAIARKASGLEHAERLKAMRWMARGLPADMALRKVLTDLEISQNSGRSRRR